MPRLILLRHAKSDWGNPALPDSDRALAARGERDAPAVGRHLERNARLPDLVLCSPARRTRETWSLAQAAMTRHIPVRHEQAIYEATVQDLIALIETTEASVATLLVVGHNPGLQDLAERLIGDGAPADRQALATKFPTASLAVIDLPGPWTRLARASGSLRAFVTHRTLDA